MRVGNANSHDFLIKLTLEMIVSERQQVSTSRQRTGDNIYNVERNANRCAWFPRSWDQEMNSKRRTETERACAVAERAPAIAIPKEIYIGDTLHILRVTYAKIGVPLYRELVTFQVRQMTGSIWSPSLVIMT